MSLLNLSVQTLEHAIELLKEKETLQSKLDEVNRRLRNLESGNVPVQDIKKSAVRLSNFKKIKKRSRRRGGLKGSILKTLKTAGSKGLSVKELAVQLKANENSIRTWIYTEGKKTTGIKKVAPGTFTYVA